MAVGLALVLGLLVATAGPATPSTPRVGPAAAVPVVPQSATLSSSASCSQGDIEIVYSGVDVERQVTNFTSGDGRELHRYDVSTYSPNHDGLEYILSQTRTPPPAGTIVAVHVTIGSSPPDPDTTGEFFVAYTCDPRPNSAGGTNVVVTSCVGLAGTCPKTAQQIADPGGVVFVPRFTG